MIKVIDNIQLTTNFKLSEFVCKDGSGEVKLDMALVNKLQELRTMIGKPVIVVSGFRNEAYNKLIGGAPKSQHLYGKAADIKVSGLTSAQLYAQAEKVGFDGIGLYDTFVHVDTRGYKARWDERTKK